MERGLPAGRGSPPVDTRKDTRCWPGKGLASAPPTSLDEHTGDAWALLTEDGRGERRNVWGERLARDEPQGS